MLFRGRSRTPAIGEWPSGLRGIAIISGEFQVKSHRCSVGLHIYIYIYIYIFIYIYIYIHTHTNLPVDAIVRLPHPRSRDSQGQETFLAPSADKQTRNYDTECSNHHPSLSTLRPKGLSNSMMKW